MVKKTKKWGKKKDSFGWIYSSKVEYHCRLEMTENITPEISSFEMNFDTDTSAIN